MEKGNTKEQILEVSLDLFSIRGFEATSIAQIMEMCSGNKSIGTTWLVLGVFNAVTNFASTQKEEN